MLDDPRRAAAREEDVITFLKQIHLFKELDEESLRRIYSRLTYDALRRGAELFAEGEAPEHFYILYQGVVRITRQAAGRDEFVAQLVSGDFFGEISLLTGNLHSSKATVTQRAVVLLMTARDFAWMIRAFPKIGRELQTITRGFRRVRQLRRLFTWLGPRESVLLVEGKHPLVLWTSLILPLLLIAAAAASIYFLGSSALPWLLYLGWTGVGLGLFWGFLRYLDWSNDYYIITNRRVVWQEKIILVYDSRQEAPLATLLSVNLDTTWLQRVFRFGDVIVRTYTGRIRMRNMEHPQHFKSALEEYWFRARKETERSRAEDVEKSIRKRLGLWVEPPPKKKKRDRQDEDGVAGGEEQDGEEQVAAAEYSSRRANLFKVRFEEEGVITYRKHWFLLLRRIGILLILLLILLFLMGASLSGVFELFSPRTYGITILALIFFSSPFWIYQYLDWSNDKYQVSEREVVDLEKRPLGREVRKSAPLENILSMEHQRIGIIGLLLNFGTVVINVGDAEFEFVGVHRPAEVQGEVFEKFSARRHQLSVEEDDRKREIVLESLEVFNRIVHEYLEEEEIEEENPEP